MVQKKIYILIDLFFFLIFLPLLITLLPLQKWIEHKPFFLVVLILYLLALYITLRNVNIPKMMLSKQYFRFAGSIGLILLITHLFATSPFWIGQIQDELRMMRRLLQNQVIWFMSVIVMGYCFFSNLLILLFEKEMEHNKLEMEKNKAQIAMYKAQINPHFLFNTLNTIYGLMITNSDKTIPSFEKFINITRYVYQNPNREFISLKEECNYIQEYVQLQSLRLNEKTHVSFHSQISRPEKMIPSMLLITFIENAFKYGVSSSTDCSICIEITHKENKTYFKVENRIFPELYNEKYQKTGIENCRKRLEMLYAENYSLKIDNNDNTFKVNLILTDIDHEMYCHR